jgi:hypothetical protein
LAYICSPDFFSKNRLITIWHEIWLFFYYKNQLIEKSHERKGRQRQFRIGSIGCCTDSDCYYLITSMIIKDKKDIFSDQLFPLLPTSGNPIQSINSIS